MRYFLGFLFFVNFTTAWALDLPALSSPVVDEAGLLNFSDRREIETWIYQYKKSGKAQIQVAIVESLQDVPIEEYSIKLVEQWKLGTGVKDDGVLFLISATDRKMRIEVGQGLEGALTDIQSKRILDDRVRPLFRSGQYAAGVAAGVAEIIKAVDPEYINAQPEQAYGGEEKLFSGGNLLYLILIILIIFLNIVGKTSRLRRRGLYGGLIGGGWGAGTGWGGGQGWGSGGGGWSGGGGGFSGGGASSNW